MDDLGKKQHTIKFWFTFISDHYLAYLALFDSIRSRNWHLRIGSLKMMSPFLSALDRPTYQCLIPSHLKTIATLPPPLIEHFEDGGFSVRLSNTDWHAVGLDECHEMMINRDAKMAVIRPSEEKMDFISNSIQFRSACLRNLQHQLFSEDETEPEFSHKQTSRDEISDCNVKAMTTAIVDHGMFVGSPDNTGLWTFLDSIKATPEQEQDLLRITEIGKMAYDYYVESRILKHPVTYAPNRKKQLCTFSVSKSQKKRISQIEKERKLSQRYIKRQVTWLAQHGFEKKILAMLYGQVSPIPRALVDDNGLPFKSSKCNTTNFLKKRYSSASVIVDVPPQWIPDCVILEGMFMVQTPAIPTMSNMQDYVKLLLDKYVRIHLAAGAKQVHIVFDNPDGLPETPKEIEHRRRDNVQDEQHKCVTLNSSSPPPIKWRSLLECRNCKRKLTAFIADEMLVVAPMYLNLTEQQKVVSNIGERVHSIIGKGTPQPEPTLRTNADEGDLRVWLHCTCSPGTKKLIFSPDTDVYHIGLSICRRLPDTTIYVQLSKSITESSKFIYLNGLLDALDKDPDLVSIPSEQRPQMLQSIYVCTGCDYISFFRGLGKVSFLKAIFEHASFIAGDADLPGSLGYIDTNSILSFLRLVGCTYFNKHKSGFKEQTPRALYHTISNSASTEEHHYEWLTKIREVVWERADTEHNMLPTTEALRLHWKRCLWVVKMWHSAQDNDIHLPVLSGRGWERDPDSGLLQVTWESATNIQNVQNRIDYVLSGCKCKTGCTNSRCKSVKSSQLCGPGCCCVSCQNAHKVSQPQPHISNDEIDQTDSDHLGHQVDSDSDHNTSDDSPSDIEKDPIMQGIMEEVFGV